VNTTQIIRWNSQGELLQWAGGPSNMARPIGQKSRAATHLLQDVENERERIIDWRKAPHATNLKKRGSCLQEIGNITHVNIAKQK